MRGPIFRVRLFGEFLLQDEQGEPINVRSRNAQLLLAYLLLPPGRPHPRDRVIDLLWPDSAKTYDQLDYEEVQRKADAKLRNVVYELRRALEPDKALQGTYLKTKNKILQFNKLSPYWLDTETFEHLIKEGEQLTGEAKADRLSKAVALYRGDLLEGAEALWCAESREPFKHLLRGAINALVDYHSEQRDYRTAIAYAKQGLVHAPYEEALYLSLIKLSLLVKDRTSAQQHYQELEQRLRADLDVEPLPETKAAYEALTEQSALGQIEALQLQADEANVTPRPLESPFVARQRELEQFVRAWNATKAGKGQALIIAGEAGVGKTRLAEECRFYVANERGITMRAQCSPITALPYQPLAEAIRSGLDVLTDQQQEIPHWALQEVVKVVPELAQHFSPVTPSSTSSNPGQDRQRLFEGFYAYFNALAQQRPLLLFIDDLQWADASTLQVVDYVVRRAGGSKIMLLLTYREGEIIESHPLLTLLQHLTRDHLIQQLPLAALERREVEHIVQGMLVAEHVGDLGQTVFERSKGLPFFVVELVTWFVETRVLSKDNEGHWQLQADQLAHVTVPPTVLALVQSRLSSLGQASRHLLNLVATFGRPVPVEVLTQVMGAWGGEVLKPVEELTWSQFLGEQETKYLFRHDLVRQVIYEEMLPERRRVLHLSIGETLESLRLNPEETDYGDELFGGLAHHFYEARKWRKALEYGLKAGRWIWSKTYAKDEALRFYRRALALAKKLNDDRGITQAYKGMGEVQCFSDELDEGLTNSIKALERLTNPKARADLYCAVANVYQHRREFETALSYCQRALEELGPKDRSLTKAKVLHHASDCLNWLLRYEETIVYCGQALNILKKSPNDPLKISILSDIGHAYSDQSKHQKAAHYLSAMAQLTTKSGDFNSTSEAYFKLGMSYFNVRHFDAAIASWEKSLDTLETIGNRQRDMAVLLHWMALACMALTDLDRAQDHAEKCLHLYLVDNEPLDVANAYTLLACLHEVKDNPRESAAAFKKIDELAAEEGLIHQGIILAYLLLDDVPKALGWFRKKRDFLAPRHLEYLRTGPAFNDAFEKFRQDPSFSA